MTYFDDHFVSKIESWSRLKPNRPAIHHVIHENPLGERIWSTYTWLQYFEEVQLVANGLIALGFEVGDRAAIIGRNRPEWLFAQMGIMAAGGISASIYTTNSSVETAFVISHSGSKFVFAEDQTQYEKILKEKESFTELEKVILMDPVLHADPEWTISFDQLKELGRTKTRDELKIRMKNIGANDTAFLIYTSGTTGTPKAVLAHQQGLSFLGKVILERFTPSKNLSLISYLPLSHIAEQTVTNIVHLQAGGEVYLCREIGNLKDYLLDVQPNILLGVPRVWEKVESALKTKFEEMNPLQAALLKTAMKIEFEYFEKGAMKGEYLNPIFRKIINFGILSKIRKKMGVNQLQYALTGAAPISKATQDFFASLGIPLMEIYGLSESLGVAIASLPLRPRSGSIGYPLNGIEVKIADDGELLIRGPSVTKGYFQDQAATEDLLKNGWLHTGDIGVRDPDGSYRITDRKKEIIITAGGKNVAPTKIENYLKSIPGVSQAVLIGDQKPYLVALLTLENSMQDAVIAEHISKINELLPKDETVKKFKVLPDQFTVQSGELTATQKIKRRVILEKYSDQINELYR
jgi:long-chain acyl-CoA synthetase